MREALKESFRELYGEFEELEPSRLDNPEVEKTYELYSSWEWKFGKSPDCETSYSTRFDWGEVEIWLRLHSMYIEEIKVYSDTLDTELPGMLEQLLYKKRYDMKDVHVTEEALKANPQQKSRIEEVVNWLAGLRE